MIEKRFIVDDCGTVIDVQTRDTFDYVSEVVDLLNEQHERIQDQKRQLDELDGLLNEFEVTFEELEDILYMNRSRL